MYLLPQDGELGQAKGSRHMCGLNLAPEGVPTYSPPENRKYMGYVASSYDFGQFHTSPTIRETIRAQGSVYTLTMLTWTI